MMVNANVSDMKLEHHPSRAVAEFIESILDQNLCKYKRLPAQHRTLDVRQEGGRCVRIHQR